MKKGSTLLGAMIISSLLIILSALFLKIVYNTYLASNLLIQREAAFWLAEAGIEKGKFLLARNLNWYTDLPHYPEDDVQWLKTGAVGQRENMGGNYFKIVREMNKNLLYAVGYHGKAVAIIKVCFSPGSVSNLKWEEL
ncbi:MAG: hypothetical protein ACPL4K_03950 [Candidatus Margulisiibacteriota bacterium]